MNGIGRGLFGLWMIAATALPAQESRPGVTLSAHRALSTGKPFSGVTTVSLDELELAYPILLARGRQWDLEWPMAVIPVMFMRGTVRGPIHSHSGAWWTFETERSTSVGMGIKPIGLRVVRHLGHTAAFLGVSGGAVWFDRPTPAANAHRGNYLGELDAGIRVRGPDGGTLVLGYRFNHLSNAGRGDVNPGVDSHMLSVGLMLAR